MVEPGKDLADSGSWDPETWLASLPATERHYVAKLKAELASVTDAETWVCPECGSIDTEEHHYLDDFSSRRCNACTHTGDPGTDFPLANALLRRIAELDETLARVIRAVAHEKTKVETLQRERIELQQQIVVRDERIAVLEEGRDTANLAERAKDRLDVCDFCAIPKDLHEFENHPFRPQSEN